EQTRRVAAVLAARGVGRGDRVAVMLPNVPDFPRVYYAVLALGAVVVPVHPLLRADEIEHVLRTAGTRLAVGRDGADVRAATVGADVDLLTAGAADSELAALVSATAPVDGIVPTGPLDPAAML